MQKVTIAVNANGLRIGEDHQNAKLTDAEVDHIRKLNESGVGYKRLARMFEVSRSSIAMICRYERRVETPASYRTIRVA